MHRKTFTMFLIYAAAAMLLRGADTPATKAPPTSAEAAEVKAKAEAEATKAKAEAEAQANGAAYGAARATFDSLMTSNLLDTAATAARTMVECAARPGKGGGWRDTGQTYAYLAKAFADKKIFGRKQAIGFYEEAIGKLAGNAKAEMLMQYGFYLDDYALADEATAGARIAEAFKVADLTPAQKIALCRTAAQRNDWREVDSHAAKALEFAEGDIKAQTDVRRWQLQAGSRDKLLDDLCKDYDAFMADNKFKGHSQVVFGDYIGELIRRRQFDKALALLDKAPKELDEGTRRNSLRLRADLHRQAAARYYDSPDPDELKLAIAANETIIAEIPTNRPRDTIPYQVSIAEIAWEAGDSVRARTTAEATLKLIDNPASRESQQLLYLLGKMACEAEDYAAATNILEGAYGNIRGKPGYFPRRRDMVEALVRSSCALDDFAKASDYATDLLELVGRHEKRRYQIYVDGLRKRL